LNAYVTRGQLAELIGVHVNTISLPATALEADEDRRKAARATGRERAQVPRGMT
jgi:hypothetical protein